MVSGVEEEAQEQEDAPDLPVEKLPEFDPKVRADFEGLLYLGALTKSFTWLGHRFWIRTLTIGEMLEVAEAAGRYAQTIGAGKAYQAATVAACVRTVDGQAIAVPLTNEPLDSPFTSKFLYICRSWFPPTVDKIYNEFLALDEQVQKVVNQMGEAFGQTGQ